MPSDAGPRRIELRDRDDAAEIMTELHAGQQSAFPLGLGSTMGHGAHPGEVDALLSTRNMNGILRLDKEDLSCSVAAGTSFKTFLAEIAEAGLAFAPGPFALATDRSVAGVLGEGVKSPRGFDRSELRSQVIGIEAVDGTGRSFKAGGRVVKNVAGYDLARFFVGSGGAYFVACSFELRLIVKPQHCAVYCSELLPRRDALRLWRNLREEQHDACSLDILLMEGGGARVRLMLAGLASLLKRIGKPRGIELEMEGASLWDDQALAHAARLGECQLRGYLPIGTLDEFLGSLPEGCVGQIHMHGAFCLGVANASALRFPERSIVRSFGLTREREGLPRELRASAESWTVYAKRLKQMFGGNLAPMRLAFDCDMDEQA